MKRISLTFVVGIAQAGLEVVTRAGNQILTIKSAKELNATLNYEHKMKHSGGFGHQDDAEGELISPASH